MPPLDSTNNCVRHVANPLPCTDYHLVSVDRTRTIDDIVVSRYLGGGSISHPSFCF